MNVMKTRKLDLCLSCEICMAVCPTGSVTMEYESGQYLPIVNTATCTECGICLRVCPGIDVDPCGLRHKYICQNIFDEPSLESYTAYTNNPEIRENSASGGVVTQLVLELVNNKEYDAAFILRFNKFNNKPARLEATHQIDEIIDSAKSKYIPASVYNVIVALREKTSTKYVIVGTPCQFSGIKKYLAVNNISDSNLLFLGLFCGGTYNFNLLSYFEDCYKKSKEQLVQFQFRTKETCGWPGNSKASFDSGRNIFIDREERIRLKRYFQLNRCLYCLDKLNRTADISFGDCYLTRKSSFNGKSSVIVRTAKGKETLDKYSYLFTLEKETVENIQKSQNLVGKISNLEYVKLLIRTHPIYPDEVLFNAKGDDGVSKRLLQQKKYLNLGKNYNRSKIRYSLFLSRIAEKSRFVVKRTLAGISFGECLLISCFRHRRNISKDEKKSSVIIIGGGLFNKGAQAMTFTVVDQMKRRFPGKNIYLFSTEDFQRDDKEKSLYKFDILPWRLATKMQLLGFWGSLFFKRSSDPMLGKEVRDTIGNSFCIIDISGFALSSVWGFSTSLHYLLNILIAKRHSIPYYIFPQSIGPFDYDWKAKIVLYPLMKFCLEYPQKILCREEEGVRYLRKFSSKNVEQCPDLVLQLEKYNLAHIFNNHHHFDNIEIEPGSVGVVPNLRVIEQSDENRLYDIYVTLINTLLNAKKTVYLLRHSFEDLEICQKIVSFFPNENRVKLLGDDLNAIQLENILQRFDFVIASRYHSIVHSYRKGVPVLAIGWSDKYHQLLRHFHQLEYYFDCRSNINISEIDKSLEKLIHNHESEGQVIVSELINLKDKNAFRFFDKL